MESHSQTSLVCPRPPSSGRPQSARGSRPRPQSAGARSNNSSVTFSSSKGLLTGQKMNNRPSSAGRRMLPAELGLAGRRILALPAHIDQCDQGENCCWRWLAHAVLRESAWLKEDLDSVRKEHEEQLTSRTKVENDIEAYAELRGSHSAMQSELKDLRHESAELRRELMALKAAHAHKVSREQELQREVSRLEAEKGQMEQRQNEAKLHADHLQQQLAAQRSAGEEMNHQILRLEDAKAQIESESKRYQVECAELRKTVDLLDNKKRKPKNSRSIGIRRTPSRSPSAYARRR
eukprot:TRINITY_DN4260_c0_g1_i1.p1 TRINITY_DN4260_c0_g1~~TRINITY_DN4260_c0_g1_i1.p1  ORF type:complete len:292 (-),score=56.69 TRINITY_DN4260_c0_g1_i1:2-877(-)